MVAMVTQFLELKGRHVELEFVDGEVAKAHLLKVDPDEHMDIVFDILAARRSVGETYTRKKVYVAPIETVRSVRPLPPS